MKSAQTINGWMKDLWEVVEGEAVPTIESRIAWLEYHLLRRIVEKTVDWEDPITDLKGTADLIRRENNI